MATGEVVSLVGEEIEDIESAGIVKALFKFHRSRGATESFLNSMLSSCLIFRSS